VTWKRFRSRHSFGFAADCESFNASTIQANIDLMRFHHSDDVVIELTSQTNVENILTIFRKVMANHETTLRTEQKILTHPVILGQIYWNLVHDRRAWLRITNGKSTNNQRDG